MKTWGCDKCRVKVATYRVTEQPIEEAEMDNPPDPKVLDVCGDCYKPSAKSVLASPESQRTLRELMERRMS